MAFDIAAWSNFGVAVVSGAAALTGLLFVAVSINSAWFWSANTHRDRAGQALVLFIVPLVTGILLLVPGQGTTVLGIEIVVFGLLVGRVLLALGSEPLDGEPRWLVLIDRFSPRLITTAGLIAGGASLIVRHAGGLYRLAAVDVCALLAGLLNAWIFLLAAGAEKANLGVASPGSYGLDLAALGIWHTDRVTRNGSCFPQPRLCVWGQALPF